jgi:hypothetical protein
MVDVYDLSINRFLNFGGAVKGKTEEKYLAEYSTPVDFFLTPGRAVNTLELRGSGFSYSSQGSLGGPESGRVNSILLSIEGNAPFELSGISLSVEQIKAWAWRFDAAEEAEILAALFGGDDTIVGSNANDILSGYAGNDVIDGRAGHDQVLLGPGSSYRIVVWNNVKGAIPLDSFTRAEHGIDKLIDVETIKFSHGNMWADQFIDDFSPLEYIASYGDLAAAFGADASAGFDHYIYSGALEGRRVSFSGDEYLASYADLQAAFGTDADAASGHYIQYGRQEGRSVLFDGKAYIASYSDLIAAFGTNADKGAEHFLKRASTEGRKVTFDGLEYIASYGDLSAALGNNARAGASHYLQSGLAEGRSVSFDGLTYIASHSDLVAAFGTNSTAGSEHYIRWGRAEGRDAASFDAAQYMANYADLRAAFGTDLEAGTVHWIRFGHAEGRTDEVM